MTRRILVVDDMEFNRQHLKKLLEADGFEVEATADGRMACDRLGTEQFHLVITDLRMPEFSGMDLLQHVRKQRLPIGVIVLTAYGDPLGALEAMKAKADDFVAKPYEPDLFRLVVKRVLERRALFDELEQLRLQMRGEYHFHTMVSKSPKMRKVFDLIAQVGPIGSTVLIEGETGTGKELVAQAIHAADTRRAGTFVALNCAVLNDSLLETELFGHEKGAFTGADRRKIGRFELADGGTLLLDEVADIPPVLQAKLLRVLQTGSFERVGGHESINVDVRIVAATNKKLEDEVKEGRFRRDLFYRLNVIRLELPPLRDRREDIPLLALHFLEKHRTQASTPMTEIASATMQALLAYHWPGNVRELENAIKSGIALADGKELKRDDLPESVVPRTQPNPQRGPDLLDIDRSLPDLTGELIARIEREYFTRALVQFKGNVARCARHSGLSRRSVTQKLQKYGLERRQFKSNGRDKAPEGLA
jgi:DNA-binding NtrC family response regulator